MYLIALFVHAVLGIAATTWIIRLNRGLFRRGSRTSALEFTYWAIGIASIVLGWCFNIRFVVQYYPDGLNPLWGDGASWTHYTALLFQNWAADSAGQDYIMLNVLILPLLSIVGGIRMGLPKPWLFFVTSLFTSAVFGFTCYLIVAERHRRLTPANPQPRMAR